MYLQKGTRLNVKQTSTSVYQDHADRNTRLPKTRQPGYAGPCRGERYQGTSEGACASLALCFPSGCFPSADGNGDSGMPKLGEPTHLKPQASTSPPRPSRT